ncbi:MAG TPA: ABC transporter substrate binding protein [Synergistaceae bacterium]|nr:ABC transporter substrate binding protein [Synergistaceae bacterium]
MTVFQKFRHFPLWRSFLWLLLFPLLFLLPAISPAFGTEVFFVSSYHEGDLCGQPQYDAAAEALRQSNIPDLHFRGYFLDSRRRSAEKIDEEIADIVKELRERKPALVITIDDLAFARLYEEVLRHPWMRLVFTGLNRPLEEYHGEAPFLDAQGLPGANITGVFEYLFMKEQMQMLEVLLGRPLNKVGVLYSADPMGKILKDQILRELENTGYRNHILFYEARNLPEVLEKAEILGSDPEVDAWIPVTMFVPDPEKGTFLTMGDLAKPMMALIAKPDLTLNVSFTKLGFYGGVSVNFYEMGFQAGLMGAKLLQGHSIKNIPIQNAQTSLIAINRSRMRELNLPLPSDFAGIVDIFLE